MKSVFINCPFDDQYSILQRALIFSVRILGLKPILSTSSNDCSEQRLMKIINYIKEADYSIHDISRNKSPRRMFCRMNMPFELGIDFGLKYSDNPVFQNKKMLILDNKKYEYLEVISDLSGCDIVIHNNDQFNLIKEVRNWLVAENATSIRYGEKVIWNMLNDFNAYIYEKRVEQGAENNEERNKMPLNEILENLEDWLTLQVTFQH